MGEIKEDACAMKLDVDMALCVSLKERADRRELLKPQFSLFSNDIEYFLADRDAGNPERGCFDSHRAIAEIGLQRGGTRCLVFEDDIVVDQVISKALNDQINRFLERSGWDILYLGGLLGRIWPTSHWGIVGCSLLCAHAYILSEQGMRKLAAAKYDSMPVDVLFATAFKSYAVFPLFVSQISNEGMRSDIAESANRVGSISDKVWRGNRRRQYLSVLKNIGRFERL